MNMIKYFQCPWCHQAGQGRAGANWLAWHYLNFSHDPATNEARPRPDPPRTPFTLGFTGNIDAE